MSPGTLFDGRSCRRCPGRWSHRGGRSNSVPRGIRSDHGRMRGPFHVDLQYDSAGCVVTCVKSAGRIDEGRAQFFGRRVPCPSDCVSSSGDNRSRWPCDSTFSARVVGGRWSCRAFVSLRSRDKSGSANPVLQITQSLKCGLANYCWPLTNALIRSSGDSVGFGKSFSQLTRPVPSTRKTAG